MKLKDSLDTYSNDIGRRGHYKYTDVLLNYTEDNFKGLWL